MHSRRLLKQACGPQTDQTRVRTRRALNIEMLFCIKSRIGIGFLWKFYATVKDFHSCSCCCPSQISSWSFCFELNSFIQKKALLKGSYDAISCFHLSLEQCSNYTVNFGGAHLFVLFCFNNGGVPALVHASREDLQRYITATSVYTTCAK